MFCFRNSNNLFKVHAGISVRLFARHLHLLSPPIISAQKTFYSHTSRLPCSARMSGRHARPYRSDSAVPLYLCSNFKTCFYHFASHSRLSGNQLMLCYVKFQYNSHINCTIINHSSDL
ncbi:unnamed protein product [Chrysodeixis includens]|uniref:Uncharacterized protein n=1 Tax=Chrysodeixis includens TaxID=689277 RepID=A0A9N8L5P2_CHRIL|nr:unnamed protein product [Chrysodeixis includens]